MDKEDSNDEGGEGVQPENPKDVETKAELPEEKDDSPDVSVEKGRTGSPGATESPSETR